MTDEALRAPRSETVDPAYRPCVLAVFTNASGKVLVAERVEPKGAWQFPQGGIEAGETAEAALFREMKEELGTDAFEVARRGAGLVRYDFPVGGSAAKAKKFRGQEQVWFHVTFRGGAAPDLAQATHREFGATAWVSVAEALERCVDWKKAAYREGLKQLGLLKDPGQE
jgi:putative (di)nucleoside polyphosphate hydrolase